jgi:ABC-type sugar transport system substrate-binding protein
MKNHQAIKLFNITRTQTFLAIVLGLVLNAAVCFAADKKIVVGFSQIGAESGWRTANTDSIKSEAAKRGVDLKFADAQQKQENQIKALRSFIAQGGCDRVFAGG